MHTGQVFDSGTASAPQLQEFSGSIRRLEGSFPGFEKPWRILDSDQFLKQKSADNQADLLSVCFKKGRKSLCLLSRVNN